MKALTSPQAGGLVYTPLQAATKYGHKMMAFVLLGNGADINGTYGNLTALQYVICWEDSSPGVVRKFIVLGADVNKYQSKSALHLAAERDQAEIIRLLIKHGAELEAREKGRNSRLGGLDKMTPLHAAIKENKVGAARALLNAGADSRATYVVEGRSMSPLELASTLELSPTTHQMISALVAASAGECQWEFVPTPCPYLERALSSVWRQAPEDLPELFNRLEDPVKEVIRESLKVLQLHGRLPTELRMKILGAALQEETISDSAMEQKRVKKKPLRLRVFANTKIRIICKALMLIRPILLTFQFHTMFEESSMLFRVLGPSGNIKFILVWVFVIQYLWRTLDRIWEEAKLFDMNQRLDDL